MSKSAEDILKEMDAVEELSKTLDEVVEASNAVTKEAEKVAMKSAAAPVAAPVAKAVPVVVVPGMKLPLSELLKPAYKPDGFAVAPMSADVAAQFAAKPEAKSEAPAASVPVAAPVAAPVAEAAPRPELTSGNRPGVTILPATGKILENLSSTLELTVLGMHASIQRARINEQDDQIGHLSMVIANLKKVQTQVDGLLGRI